MNVLNCTCEFPDVSRIFPPTHTFPLHFLLRKTFFYRSIGSFHSKRALLLRFNSDFHENSKYRISRNPSSGGRADTRRRTDGYDDSNGRFFLTMQTRLQAVLIFSVHLPNTVIQGDISLITTTVF